MNTQTLVSSRPNPADFLPEEDILGIKPGKSYRLAKLSIEQNDIGYLLTAKLATWEYLTLGEGCDDPGAMVEFKASLMKYPQVIGYVRALMEFTSQD